MLGKGDNGPPTTTVDLLHNDKNVLQFVALLQQTLEHELGHLKFRTEGVLPLNGGKPDKELLGRTPEELRFEAGYAVKCEIRKARFQDEVAGGELVLIEQHSPVGDLPVETCRSYLSPNLKFRNSDDGGKRLDIDEDEEFVQPLLDKDEILRLMDYPKAGSYCLIKKRKRDDNSDRGQDDNDEPSEGGGDSNNGEDGKRDDRSPPKSSSGRAPCPWQESIQRYLPREVNNAQLHQFKSSLPLRRSDTQVLSRHAGGRVTDEKIAAFQSCHFRLKLCDISKNETTRFSPGDRICALITVTNTTADPAVVYLTAGKYFGQYGLIVEIEGLMRRPRMGNSYIHRMILEADEDYSCFRVLTKSVGDDQVGYATPPVGQYIARASVFGKPVGNPVQFSVVNDENRCNFNQIVKSASSNRK